MPKHDELPGLEVDKNGNIPKTEKNIQILMNFITGSIKSNKGLM